MRLAFALALSFVGLLGCSSEEATGTVDSGPNKCVAAGYECAVNFPFVCRPGKEPIKGDLATACGTTDGKDIPCCVMAVDVDTGVDTGRLDTGAGDAAADGTAETSTDATTDAASDAKADATSTDAAADG